MDATKTFNLLWKTRKHPLVWRIAAAVLVVAVGVLTNLDKIKSFFGTDKATPNVTENITITGGVIDLGGKGAQAPGGAGGGGAAIGAGAVGGPGGAAAK